MRGSTSAATACSCTPTSRPCPRSRRCTSTPTGTGRSSRPSPTWCCTRRARCPRWSRGTASTAGGRPFDDFIPELTFERFDADEYAQLLDDAGMRYLVHVTKHHDGFCWWDTALLDAHRRSQLGPEARRHRRARRRGARGAATCSAATTRCSTGATPTIPIPSATSTRSCARRSRSSSSGSSPRCCGATATGAIPARHWRADEILADARVRTRPSAASSSCSTTGSSRREPDFARVEYDVPDVAARRAVGAVPRARLLVLREPQRARRGPPHRRAGRRAARGDGRQGRQPAAERRPERRRHRARHPGADAARLGRVGARARRRDPRLDALRRARRRAALVHARPATHVHAFDLVVGAGAAVRRARRRAARARRPTAPSSRSGVDAGVLVDRRARRRRATRSARATCVELATREHVGRGRAAAGRRGARRRATRRSPRRSPGAARATSSTSGRVATRARRRAVPARRARGRDAARRRLAGDAAGRDRRRRRGRRAARGRRRDARTASRSPAARPAT